MNEKEGDGVTLYLNPHLQSIKRLKQQRICIKYHGQQTKETIRILIVNLMPNKIDTEFQFLSLIGSLSIDITVDFINMASYRPKNTDYAYLNKAYKTYRDIKKLTYDRVIITGAPLEFIPFSQILYWEELKKIFAFVQNGATSTLYICWAAIAGLYYHYNVKKRMTSDKVFGVFSHTIKRPHDLLTGLSNGLLMPHSRYVYLDERAIQEIEQLDILIHSTEAGVTLVSSKNNRHLYLTAHPEYERDTLQKEYMRDKKRGINIKPPKNHHLAGNWENHAKQFFYNWIAL
ncbi:homoserine O-succinyltransferase [Cerasibacillus quisquiliarum]|uniref:Homoserine O-acetyltransferase n=1 Tax=Cerasibacillus quisquiliarum TaxID=227865 RepID=A0A511UY54_9BACI|nr:homoserine O-succinyltransferase [Cerasibacillus quisquiliarum]MBB5145046.1 homoserine O-succinyltransferase [Cerasibacillus quisquiliarum]GEN30062.1 homoserine O-succinyltransferase [Cerasibacillus quisquiliarum]